MGIVRKQNADVATLVDDGEDTAQAPTYLIIAPTCTLHALGPQYGRSVTADVFLFLYSYLLIPLGTFPSGRTNLHMLAGR